MNRKGISYDVGHKMGISWRPDYDASTVHRELATIKNDLHCNAVRICAVILARLMSAAEDALGQDLEVWLSPELWNRSPQSTLDYLIRAATAAEKLRVQYPNRLVLILNSELTLFVKVIIAARTLMRRLQNAFSGGAVRSGAHNKPLNEFLSDGGGAEGVPR